MQILVRREPTRDGLTFGRLYINGVYHMNTLDPHVVPPGRYRITLYHSPHFNRTVPLLHGIPGHDFIEIHSGNTINQTKGCILVGLVRNGPALFSSISAFGELMHYLLAIPHTEEIWITIEEARS